MQEIVNATTQAIILVCTAVITGVAGYAAVKVKEFYKSKIDTQTKKDVVNTTVKYVEQIYTDIHGRDKLEKALQTAEKFLTEKGVQISKEELEVMIEAAVNTFNAGLAD